MNAIESAAARSRGVPPVLLVGGVFALTTVANFAFNSVIAAWDLAEDFGAGGRSREDQLPVIAVLGVLALVVALVLAKVFSGEKGVIVKTCGSACHATFCWRPDSSGRSTSLPRSKVAPARTRATRCGALTARQRRCADSMSLNAIAMPAAREPGPLVTR